MTKRVIECNVCGEPLAAANDDELLVQVRRHYASEHADAPMDEDQAREVIAREAYDAGDA
jgi:predicted small metal-binding protein